MTIKRSMSVLCLCVFALAVLFMVHLAIGKLFEKNLIYSSNEFIAISGTWKLIEFSGDARESHSIDIQTDDKEGAKANAVNYLGVLLVINPKNVMSLGPPSELGYYYTTADELHFGYKLPSTVSIKAPILYVSLKHREYEKTIHFIMGSNNAYVDIEGCFYKLEKTS